MYQILEWALYHERIWQKESISKSAKITWSELPARLHEPRMSAAC